MSWGAVIAGGSAVAAAGIGYLSSDKASDKQKDAADASAQVQWDMYQQGREDMAPWRAAGEDSVNVLRKKMGLSYYRPIGATSDQGGPWGNALQGGPVMGAHGDADPAKVGIAPSLGGTPVASAGAPGSVNTLAAPAAVDMQALQSKYMLAEMKRDRARQKLAELDQAGRMNYNVREYQGLESDIRKYSREIADVERQLTAAQQAPADPGQPGGGAPDGGDAPPGYELVPGTGELQMGEFEESPGYQFTLKEGLNAQQNALSAMGQNRSGKHLKASAQYAEGLASTEYDNFLARWYDTLKPYQSMAGMGQTSASQTANSGAAAGASIGNSMMAGGDASAAGYINKANALTGAIQGGANSLLYYNSLRNLPQYNYQHVTGTPNTTGQAVDQWRY